MIVHWTEPNRGVGGEDFVSFTGEVEELLVLLDGDPVNVDPESVTKVELDVDPDSSSP